MFTQVYKRGLKQNEHHSSDICHSAIELKSQNKNNFDNWK